MVEAAIGQEHLVQRVLAGVAERRVAKVVDERHALRQVLVKLQGARQGTGDLGDLDRVRQARAIMIAVLRDEDLRLVLQTAKSRRMDDAVAIALKFGTRGAAAFGIKPSARRPRGLPRWAPCPLAVSKTQRLPVDLHFSPSFNVAQHLAPLTPHRALHTYSQHKRQRGAFLTALPNNAFRQRMW